MVNNEFLFVFVFLFRLRDVKSLDGNLIIYFLPPLVAVAADLVTLLDAAAFFSTSLMTPTATV